VTADGDRTFTANYGAVSQAPVAIAFADVDHGAAPLAVNFDATHSSDPNAGGPLTYEWDLDGDGVYDDSTAPKPGFVYETPGVRMVGLRATDGDGMSGLDIVPIIVSPLAARFSGLSSRLELRVKVDGSGAERVRLLGVDLPARKGECARRGAKRRLATMISPGDALELSGSAGMPDRDRRGALIRTVALDGTDLGLRLVRAGWARVHAGSQFEAMDAYRAAQREAKRGELGAWGCRAGPPGQ
jgi:endonuclease YncB( thermonuclease family)